MIETWECLGLIGTAFVTGVGAGYQLAGLKAGPQDAVDEMTKHCDILTQHADHDGSVVTFTQRGKLVNLRCWAMLGKQFCPYLKARCVYFDQG